MCCEKLVLVRNFLYKWFAVGFLIFTAVTILYLLMQEIAVDIAEDLFNINPMVYYLRIFDFLAIVKLILILFILSPALALHWMIACCNSKNEQ